MVKKGSRYIKPNYGREIKQKRSKTMVAKQALESARMAEIELMKAIKKRGGRKR